MNKEDFEKQQYFGFYGSLRKGEYNYMHLMKDREGVEYVETVKIPGYDLYSLGSFPMAFKTEDEKPMTIDIFKITNKDVIRRIDGMEVGAGYQRTVVKVPANEKFNLPNLDVLIYLGNQSRHSWYVDTTRIIPDGDWAHRNNAPRRNLNDEGEC